MTFLVRRQAEVGYLYQVRSLCNVSSMLGRRLVARGWMFAKKRHASPSTQWYWLKLTSSLGDLSIASNILHCAKISAGWWSTKPWDKKAYMLMCWWTQSCGVIEVLDVWSVSAAGVSYVAWGIGTKLIGTWAICTVLVLWSLTIFRVWSI